jgi:hypothetical protein
MIGVMDEPSTDPELLDLIKRTSGAFDVSQVTTYLAYRKDPDGVEHPIKIEVHDSGPAEPDQRWQVIATNLETGEDASGTNAASLGAVLATVQWQDLDK